MESQKVRIAQVKGFVVKKRCRKQEFTIVEGIGENDEEAIEKMKVNFQEEKKGWKDSRFSQGIIFDGRRQVYNTYSSVMRPLIPGSSDNVVSFEFIG
jgi:hypothetical protein